MATSANEIGERVRKARGERTRREIAVAAGVTEQTVYRVELGTAMPEIDTIDKIAAALGMTRADFVV